MEGLLHVENENDSEMICPEVKGHCWLITEEEVVAKIKGLNIGKSADPTSIVSEMMKASGDFGTRCVIDLIDNIVTEGCVPDEWRKSIPVHVYVEKGQPLMSGSYGAIKLLEQPIKGLE